MNKKYLMKGFAALALIAGFTSCVKDVDGVSAEEVSAKGKENAELQLGITIPDGQTWDMASQVTATVTVNGDYNTTYVVNIYEQNPFTNGNVGTILGRASVTSGNTAEFDFTCPNYLTSVFASIKDEKGYTYVKPVAVENGKVEAVFGDVASGSRAMRAASATNSHVNIPTCTITNAYVQSFLEGAVEPTDANVVDNYDNSYVASCVWYATANGKLSTLMNNYTYCVYDGSPVSQSDKDWYTDNVLPLLTACNWNWNSNSETAYNILQKLKSYTGDYNYWNLTVNSEGGLVADETYVTKFKITGTWNKLIGVLPTEEADGDPRTVYVSGTWTIPAGKEQRVGGGAVIVIVEGGEIVIPEGSQLNFVNQARLVNAGGTISGAGTINVTNGNAAGEEGYNSGTITVGKFNQNFGTFFNYGTFANYATELNGGAGTSTFVNHGHMYISGAPKGSSSANMQIKNNCWFEASGEVAGKLIENGAGSYFKAGALDLSSAEGGEGIGTYIAADTNSKMVITGAVKLNSTLIYGPTSGDEAYLEFDNIKFLNVGETYPINGKLNIYVGGFTGDNSTGYETSWNTNMAAGDGKAQMVGKAAFNTAATDASDCAPAFTPATPPTIVETPIVYTYAFEDQIISGDYDMNDVVLKVNYHVEKDANGTITSVDHTKLDVKMVAAGATFNIKVLIGGTATSRTAPNGEILRNVDLEGGTYLFGGKEIHEAFGVNEGVMVNTGNGKAQSANPVSDTVDAPSDWDGDFTHLRFSIEVLTTGNTFTYPNDDVYPYALMIPTDWAWPLETIKITEAYAYENAQGQITESFTWWAQTSPHPQSAERWYTHPVVGKVMIDE